jgi:hypothetical protein
MERVCPSCEGHCELMVGQDYYTLEYVTDLCAGCWGTGVLLWMMPGTSRRRREREADDLFAGLSLTSEL